MKILIADDNPLDLSILKLTLEKWGYDVITAADGREALEKLTVDDPPPLAILDWMMPELTGPEVCGELRFQQTNKYMYILILSSRTEKADVISGMQSGADDYLDKPVDVHELQVRLRAGRRIIELQEELIAAREELRVQATIDSLTGVNNRANIMNITGRELNRATRTGNPMGLVMTDVDKFKSINDNYGHPAGDAVLKQVVERISGCLREYDAMGRFGGEEFLIIFTEIDPENIKNAAERIRKTIADTPMQIPGSEITVTMSFGTVAYMPGEPADKEALIARTDAALYQAKEGGRNQVVEAEPVSS